MPEPQDVAQAVAARPDRRQGQARQRRGIAAIADAAGPGHGGAATEAPPQLLVLSKDEFAASNIANIPSHHDDDSGDGAGSGKDSGSAYGPGEGPGGERLYDAEWYREPTHAEMATYMPPDAQTGWGMIACKTVDATMSKIAVSSGNRPSAPAWPGQCAWRRGSSSSGRPGSAAVGDRRVGAHPVRPHRGCGEEVTDARG